MGYLHISNLYRDQRILLFKEVWALEKVHGTSAHVRWQDGRIHLASGGEKAERFARLFDIEDGTRRFTELGHASVVVYGEAYGGSQQKQAWRYGPELRFVAFDVMIGGVWLTVPSAVDVCEKLGIRFVDYCRVTTDLAQIDAQRDCPSTEAQRNGVVGDQPREGVILRPLIELVTPGPNPERLIVKHKRAEERETATPREVVDRVEVLAKADEIALEWVTETRLEHVLQKVYEGGGDCNIADTRTVISAMLEDVLREAAGEIVDSKDARGAISKRAAVLFHAKLRGASA